MSVLQEEMVYEWLNPVYLKPDVQEQIREKFEADSEIELRDFLKVIYRCLFSLCLMGSIVVGNFALKS